MQYKTRCDVFQQSEVPTRGELIRLVVLAYVGAFALQAWAIPALGNRGEASNRLLLCMWVPTLAALLSGNSARQMLRRALRLPNWRWGLAGLVVGWAPALLGTTILVIARRGLWDSEHFDRAPDGSGVLAAHHIGLVFGVGPQSWTFFALNTAVSILVGSLVTTLIGGLGEELGWRGVLQPALEHRLGPVRGTLLVGVIWAYWHLPINLGGYNDAEHPVLNAFVSFPLIVLCLAYNFAWLMKRAGSVWPAALAHGANNVLGSGFLLLKPDSWLTGRFVELTATVLTTAMLVWISRRSRERSMPSAALPSTEVT
jgi:membrane protease YdiL (CAAX protease family)